MYGDYNGSESYARETCSHLYYNIIKMYFIIHKQRNVLSFPLQLCHTPVIDIPTMLCPAPDVSYIASMIDDQPIVTNLRFTTNAFQPYPIESHFIDTLLYYPNPVFYQISTDQRSLPTTDELILRVWRRHTAKHL